MSGGDPGPYINGDGDIWVPRTVPFREARAVALTGCEWGQRLRYVGKADAELVGFARDCDCEEHCYGGPENEDGDRDPLPECSVPAWHFREVGF